MPIKDAMELYYFDSMLVPLFVAENYISIIPNNVKDGSQDHIDRLADASASIAYGDILGKKIFRDQNWAISNDVAYVGTAKPARIMRGRKVNLKDSYGYYNFPSSLSKGSTTTKSYNILRGIQKASIHMASLSQRDSLDYLPLLRDTFLAPLIEDKKEGIEAAIAAMDEYGITKDDVEAIDEMATFKGKIGKQKYSDIETAVKSSFTREFNKTHKAINKGKLSKITNEDNEELNDEEKALVEDEDDLDKLANDLAKKKKEEVRLKSFDKKQQKAEEKKTKTKSKKKDSSPKEKKEPKKKLSLKKK
jgi:replication factor C subunit 1